MNAARRSNFQGGWVDWLMSAIRFFRGMRVPLLLVVDDDRVGREAEEAHDLGVVGRAEQDDRVALLDELLELLLLVDHPGAGPVDDLEAAVGRPLAGRSGVTPWARMTTAAPSSTSSSVVDGADPARLEVGDDALVVDDLAERVREPAAPRPPPCALSIASRTP